MLTIKKDDKKKRLLVIIKTYLKCFVLRKEISFTKQSIKWAIKISAVIYIAIKKSPCLSVCFSIN